MYRFGNEVRARRNFFPRRRAKSCPISYLLQILGVAASAADRIFFEGLISKVMGPALNIVLLILRD